MSVAVQSREEAVASAIREVSHIATLPEVTLKIVQLVENQSSTAQDLNRVISTDPALCSRILKVVNSSFYGLPGQIASINRAIVLLGLNAVKNIAIAASLAKLFRGGELTTGFSARNLWDHSNATAVASKMIADALKLGLADEAFLAGLMHDIGIIVEMQADRARLIEVVESVPRGPDGAPRADMLEVEERVYGANHQNFGAALCEKWKFPASFARVTGHHHNPFDLPFEQRTLPLIVYVADRLAGELEGGFRLDLASLEIDPRALSDLKLTDAMLDSIRTALPEGCASPILSLEA
ncbi:MAG: hypothetical protein AMXMBFR77_15240 [Phycisphaerales bacterium]|nr:HDOD domain-containing protein [Phycisphaerales bacterium]GIK19187.1 MAG: histidine kinase [Planctomycetota bacterium]